MEIMTGLLLALISLFIVSATTLAETGVDKLDTPQQSCSMGQMDYMLNSTHRVCMPSFNNDHCCNAGFHCGPDWTATPTPCGYATITPTQSPTATKTPSPTPT